ncbi:MAG: GGDEF domain-containing protein [Candidatus Poribacteria bacterium]
MSNNIDVLIKEIASLKEQLKLLKEENKRLKELSITDELTGLYNWRHFHNNLDAEVARNKRQNHHLSLIFLDVDGLKSFNDTYGHSGGNEILKAIAKSINESIRKDVDSAYRFGGDEFAIILPEVKSEQAVKIAKRIAENLLKSNFANVSISFGIAELDSNMDSETLIKYADSAMYLSKQKTDKIHIYNKTDN